VDPGNEFFATGSADRTIKIWDLASGQLKLTLTGHIEQVCLYASHRFSLCRAAICEHMQLCIQCYAQWTFIVQRAYH